MKISFFVGAFSAIAFAAAAQDLNTGSTNTASGSSGSQIRFNSMAEYSYIGKGDVSFEGANGKSSAQAVSAFAGITVPLDDQWFVPLTLGTKDVFLDAVENIPIPDDIYTLQFNVGLGYHINEAWTVSAAAGPLFYRLDDLNGRDIGFGGAVQTFYKYSPTLSFAAGLAIAPDNEVPVLPFVGARWLICTNLTLNLMFPKPALIYELTPKLNVYLTGGGASTVFRTRSDLGNMIGQPRYNNALGTYWDFHVGLGAEYRITTPLSVFVEGGYSFSRQIDYKRIDQTVKFDDAPFVQAGLKCHF